MKLSEYFKKLLNVFRKKESSVEHKAKTGFTTPSEYQEFKSKFLPYVAIITIAVGLGVTVYQLQLQHDVRQEATGTNNQLPRGFFDGIDTNRWVAYGWALDPDTLDSIDSTPVPDGDPRAPRAYIFVDLYVDNPKEEGVLVGRGVAYKYRPDLTRNLNYPPYHGFEISIPEEYRTGYRKFYAYAIDSSGNSIKVLLKNSQNQSDFHTIGTKPSGNAQISALVDGSPLTITTTERLAGAIDSLTWKGKEFVDSYDHGRQIQGAVFIGQGGCINPTEAGTATDGRGSTSTSVLQKINASGNHLFTQIQMSYWYKAGVAVRANGSGCDRYFTNGIPPYTMDLSSWIMTKDLTIGFLNNPHIIDYKTTILSPIDLSSGIHVEAPTAYMPYEFATFLTYNPQLKQLNTVTQVPNAEKDLPVILSTADKQYALGFYSPNLPQYGYAPYGVGYGIFDIPSSNVVKSNCVFRQGTTEMLVPYQYQCFMIVGTVQDVTSAIDQLYTHFKTATPTNTPTPSPPPPTGHLSASPNPCSIQTGKAGCATTISWSAENTPSVHLTLGDGTPWTDGNPTGSQATGEWFGDNTSITFILYSQNNQELDRITVMGKRTPTPTTSSQIVIENGSIVTSFNPWAVSLKGTNLNEQNGPFTASIFLSNGTLWQKDIPTAASSFVSFQLPSNTAPNNCNVQSLTCHIQVQLQQTSSGILSNKFEIVLPQVDSPTTVPTPSYLRSDFGGLGGVPDGKVDIQDLNILAGEFYQTKTSYKADIIKTGDSLNKVDIQDYNAFVGDFQAYLNR